MDTGLNAGYANVEGKSKALVKDIKSVVADADDLLKEVVRSTADEFATARTKVEGKLSETKSRLDDARLAATKKARDAVDVTQGYVRENPWKVLVVATAAALVTVLLLSRR